jgi:hypothetical protein
VSDPFDALRSYDAEATTPDVAAIKARARGIERRRRTVLSGGVAAIAAVAVIAVAVVAKPTAPVREVAQEKRESAQTSSDSVAAGRTSTTGKALSGESAAVTVAEQQKQARVESGSDAGAATKAGAAAPAYGAAVEQQEPLVATIDVKESTVPRQADFTLKVCNTTDETVKRSFGSAKRYDFEVKQGKEVVWRWSDDRSFAQVTGEESWAPKACKTYSETWNTMTSSGGIAPSGTYEAVGVLTASPELRTKPKTFCLSPC